MDWGSLIPAALQVGSTLLGNKLASDSSKDALNASNAAAEKALALQEKMYQQGREDIAPFRQSGLAANRRLSDLMGLDGGQGDMRSELAGKYPALFGSLGAAANPSDIYDASGDVMRGVQGINSGGYKYNQADFQRLIDAAGQPNYSDYTKEDIISAAQRLSDPNSQTKTADAQFLVDRFNRLHDQFDPKPKKKKGWFSKLLPIAANAVVPGSGYVIGAMK